MDPARWPPQAGQQPSAQQNTFQPQASTSAQSLLSVYPFASTLPTGQIAQQVTHAARGATDPRPYPSVLYPQYYQQGGGYAYPEYERGVNVLQSTASVQGALGHSESQYWKEHQDRAARLLSEEQRVSGGRGSAYSSPSQQSTTPQLVQQPSPWLNYPAYQPNAFSSSLLQTFSYPPQASIQGTHPQHSTHPQYMQYEMPTSQSQQQGQGQAPFQQRQAASQPQRSLSQSGPQSSASYQQQAAPQAQQQTSYVQPQSQSQSPAMYQQRAASQTHQKTFSQPHSQSPASYHQQTPPQAQQQRQPQQTHSQPQSASLHADSQSPALPYQQPAVQQQVPSYTHQQSTHMQSNATYGYPQSSPPHQQASYPQQQASYPQQQASYPQQQASYSQQQASYLRQQASYQQQVSRPQPSNPQQSSYTQQQSSYAQQQSSSYAQQQSLSSQQQPSYTQPGRTTSSQAQASRVVQQPSAAPMLSSQAYANEYQPPAAQPQWTQSIQDYSQGAAHIVRTHPLHRVYNTQLPPPNLSPTEHTSRTSAPFERLLSGTKSFMLQTEAANALLATSQTASAAPRPTSLAEFNGGVPLPPQQPSRVDPKSSSSTVGAETPQKLKKVPVAPATGDDDSPDPLVMGPYARRSSGISSQASPAQPNGQGPRAALLSSPLKRKAQDGKDDIDLLGSPTKKRTAAEAVIGVPLRAKPHSVEHRTVSPIKPFSQTKPKPFSMPNHPAANGEFNARPIPYVLVPPIPEEHLPKRELQTAHEDLYEQSEDMESDESLGARIRRSGVKTSGKRTGERDDRADVKKLLDYLEDIFEAEDSLPVGSRPASPALLLTSPTVAGQSSGFFSTTSDSGNEPTLLPHIMRKLLRYIEASSVETRHRRRKGRRGALSQADVNQLSRILRILDRSVKAAIDAEPFPSSSGAKTSKNTPKKSKSKTARGRKSETSTPSRLGLMPKVPVDGDRRSTSRAASDALSLGLDGELAGDIEDDMEAAVDDESPVPEQQTYKEEELNAAAVERCTHMLELVSLGTMAADCCLALLTADALPKQLYSEDTIKGCLDVAKNGLEKAVYPVVEASADSSTNTPLIKYVMEAAQSLAAQHLSSTFQSLLSILPRIDALISHGEHAMSESIVIAATYIAIGPFFVIDNSSMGDDSRKAKSKSKDAAVFALGGKAGFPALRLSALSLIRSIFANHSDQRSSIIEEILTSLIKLPDIKRKGGQFRLRNGKSIHIVSALLLQLVQTTGRDLRLSIKSLKARTVTATGSHQPKPEDGENLDKDMLTEAQMYKSGLEDAQACARSILQFLVNRSGKSKTTKDSNEAEYRAIFDNFIADLLTVLYWPEWPASSLLLRLACRLMMSSLEDVKTTADNATKQMALDHLGTIAAHLRSVSLKARPEGPSQKPKYRSLEEIVSSCSVNRFKNILMAHLEISSYLARRAEEDHSEDQAYMMAREFSLALWGHELALNLIQAVENLDSDASISAERYEKGSELVKEMSEAVRNVWRKDIGDVFEASSESEAFKVDALCQLLGATNPIQTAFDPIIHVILSSLASPTVFMRTKALRAIGQIITCDPELLRQQNVRQTIESHLVDNSSAVREAAIELIGKYIIQESALAGEYYIKLSERMADTGLGVRKRVMKLLRNLYDVTDDIPRRADICVKMIQRLQDEDETVKDLAVKSMEEMWFPPPSINGRNSLHASENQDMRVFMQVVGAFKDRMSVLEDLLRQILQDKKKDDQALVKRYTSLCDALINTLVDGQDAEFNLVHCVQGIYLLATAHPKVMSGSRADILLPYLKIATTADERAITDSVLKVFRASIPGMPKTALNFGEQLQKVLVPMISKPSTFGGITGLQETVACLCVTVKYLTHDYARLVALLRPCNVKLQVEIKALESGTWNPASTKSTPILMFIVAFLNEHCDFDLVRTEHPDTATQLDAMAVDSITEHFYMLFLKLYQNGGSDKISAAALQCLGIMFKAYPKLLTHDSTLALMDSVLSSHDIEARGRVLKILQDFLASEATKRAEEEREYKKTGKKSEVDMDELVGSANTFADSGIASIVVQRYLGQVLEGALSPHLPTQRFSVDILGYTIKQGLSHPMLCLPVLISLETSADSALAARAGTLHALLQNKHASMLNSRLIDCARKSFEYQTRVTEGAVRGFRSNPTPVALLHRWYALVRDKRAPRQDLLKAIMKAFDVDTTNLALNEDEVAFIRYMAENVSALEYKTLEEVLTVVRSLMSALSVAGMQLVDTLARLDLGDEVDADTTEGVLITQASLADGGRLLLADPFPLMRSSVAVGIILVLKGYLKGLYGLSEEKCLRFVIGKKSNLGDRPALRKHDYAMDYERLPFAMTSLLTMEDLRAQRRQFLQLWAQDGVTVDPTDDLDMDQPI